jgi:hypothetical protein
MTRASGPASSPAGGAATARSASPQPGYRHRALPRFSVRPPGNLQPEAFVPRPSCGRARPPRSVRGVGVCDGRAAAPNCGDTPVMDVEPGSLTVTASQGAQRRIGRGIGLGWSVRSSHRRPSSALFAGRTRRLARQRVRTPVSGGVRYDTRRMIRPSTSASGAEPSRDRPSWIGLSGATSDQRPWRHSMAGPMVVT